MLIPYWSTAVTVSFVSLIPQLIGFLIVLHQYNKKRYVHNLLLTSISLIILLFILFNGLSYLFLSTFLFTICVYLLDACVFFTILLIDSITKETVDPIKLTLVGVLITASFILSLDLNSVYINFYPNGELGVFQGGNLRIVNTLIYIYAGILIIYYTAKIFQNTPKKLKIYSGLYLSGIMVVGIGGVSIFILGLPLKIPGIHSVLYAINAIITAIPLALKPELAFVLPFKALKLIVIETKSGIPIFSHSWSKMEEFVDEQLFSGMLQGIRLVLNEALGKGNIHEIQLSKAILILKESEQYPVLCVLVATKSTRSLRNALNSFAENFFKKYSRFFDEFQRVDHFAGASELVADRFSFIPEYD